MLYLDYESFKDKYFETQRKYNEILSEKEELFARTQPKSQNYETERVSGGSPVNSFDEYLLKKEQKQIDERLKEVKSLLDDRGHLLKLKEQEIRASKDMYDKIYRLKFLDHRNVSHIATNTGYSKAQVYRIINSITKKIDAKK